MDPVFVVQVKLMIQQHRITLKKTLHPKSTHCCEAPKSMLSNYFCTKLVLRETQRSSGPNPILWTWPSVLFWMWPSLGHISRTYLGHIQYISWPYFSHILRLDLSKVLLDMSRYEWICPKYDWICPKYDWICPKYDWTPNYFWTKLLKGLRRAP